MGYFSLKLASSGALVRAALLLCFWILVPFFINIGLIYFCKFLWHMPHKKQGALSPDMDKYYLSNSEWLLLLFNSLLCTPPYSFKRWAFVKTTFKHGSIETWLNTARIGIFETSEGCISILHFIGSFTLKALSVDEDCQGREMKKLC